MFCLFFFFKQKTAYEMRISDWSSDVCSSDLGPASGRIWGDFTRDSVLIIFFSLPIISCLIHAGVEPKDGGRSAFAVPNCDGSAPISKTSSPPPIRRSEEHTSELQSLMRISYAVFCLKQKRHIDCMQQPHRRYCSKHITHQQI